MTDLEKKVVTLDEQVKHLNHTISGHENELREISQKIEDMRADIKVIKFQTHILFGIFTLGVGLILGDIFERIKRII